MSEFWISFDIEIKQIIVPNKQETATAPATINNSMLMIIPPKDKRFRKTNLFEFWLGLNFLQN